MQKIRKAMASSKQFPLQGDVQVDEFVIGGKEENKQGRSYDTKKKKIVGAVELTENRKIKRFYCKVIPDYSAKSLKPLFEDHIDKEAKVQTDGWKGYNPIREDYTIHSIKSIPGVTFNEIHTIIQNVKSWLRAIPTHVSKEHTQAYLDEFCYRLNRSIHLDSIFDNLIYRMVKHRKVFHNELNYYRLEAGRFGNRL
ncbi:MAG: IS1595 family transposase [Cyclobacteriaceae bacterium]